MALLMLSWQCQCVQSALYNVQPCTSWHLVEPSWHPDGRSENNQKQRNNKLSIMWHTAKPWASPTTIRLMREISSFWTFFVFIFRPPKKFGFRFGSRLAWRRRTLERGLSSNDEKIIILEFIIIHLFSWKTFQVPLVVCAFSLKLPSLHPLAHIALNCSTFEHWLFDYIDAHAEYRLMNGKIYLQSKF